jgi:leucyl-tRNA synthetase
MEAKWQQDWNDTGIYDAAQRDESKEKEYILVELPYPSGNLHIGHWYAFAVPDIYVRFKRMMGKQVLYPMGFDAFGLPAENAAIKRNVNPREWTESNIEYMKGQLASMGNSFSWDKTASTIDPDYYRWTQWMFTKFFTEDIAYRGKGTVNWCPNDNTVIANEQVLADGTCERCGDTIEKRVMPQWMLRITDYADALIDDLDNLDWPEHIKDAQRTWIGRSQGAEIDFKLSVDETVTVFTTRPDTLYGATYMVLAPEHELVTKHQEAIANWPEVETYINATKSKKEMDRLDDTKEKTGVLLEGITATNPTNGEDIPVYIADYVLAGYGTGAIMAVPAHDERDHEFAHKFGIKIQSVIAPKRITHAGGLLEVKDKPGVFVFQKRTQDSKTNPGKYALFGGGIEDGESVETALIRELEEELELKVCKQDFLNSYCYPSENTDLYICATHIKNIDTKNLVLHEGETIVEMSLEEACKSDNLADSLRSLIENPIDVSKIHVASGFLHNSAEFDGMDSEEAMLAIVDKIGGRMTNTYRLRDWSIGRQRYWGVPIPIVYDPEGKAHIVPEEHLPWTLPEDVDCKPTGEPPLAKSAELKQRTIDVFGEGWTPEVETMDTFVDSAWYFLRYIDPTNKEMFASTEMQEDWMPIDTYFGGAEHTTMHLLYSRFWQKALFKLGLVTTNEPYKRRVNHGMILGPDGNKMSKSKGNVVDPDEQVQLVGSDTVKMYLAFMGPYQDNSYPWDPGGVVGLRRFLERVNGLNEHVLDGDVDESPVTIRQLHKTINKIGADIEVFKFNTAISAMMIFVNVAEKEGLSDNTYATFLQLLAPFAPHLTEELWRDHGKTDSIHLATFPEFDSALAKDDQVTIGVQINGKMRGEITIEPDADEATAVETAQNNQQLQEKFVGTTTQKVIYVPGRILNFIVTN